METCSVSFCLAVKCGDLTSASGESSSRGCLFTGNTSWISIGVFHLPFVPLLDPHAAPQSFLQALNTHEGRTHTWLLLRQQIWRGSFLAARHINEPARAAVRTATPGTSQGTGPVPRRDVPQHRAAFLPASHADICLGMLPRLLATATHPEQTLQAVQPDRFPRGLGKQIPSFPLPSDFLFSLF